MRIIGALVSLSLLSACQPTYAEVREKYAAEYDRAAKAEKKVWVLVDEAGSPDGDCRKSGLTHAVWGYDEKDQQVGNTEVVSHRFMTLRFDKARWENEGRLMPVGSRGPNFIPPTAFDAVANYATGAQTEPGRRVWKGLVPQIEAAKSTTHLIVVRGEGSPHLEAFLFDIAQGVLVCGFAVDGAIPEGVEDRDMVVNGRSGTYNTSTNVEKQARLDDAPRQLSAALKERFGFGLELERKPSAPPPPLPKEVLDAKARFAALYAQREKEAPACGAVPADAVRLDMGVVWWGADVTPPKGLGAFRGEGFSRNEDLSRMTNPFNPASSRIAGAKGFLALHTLVIYEPAQFDAPKKDARGWTEGRLHVRGLVFTDGTLSCRREWDLVTPPDLKVPVSHGQITESSAREGATKNLGEQLQRLRIE